MLDLMVHAGALREPAPADGVDLVHNGGGDHLEEVGLECCGDHAREQHLACPRWAVEEHAF